MGIFLVTCGLYHVEAPSIADDVVTEAVTKAQSTTDNVITKVLICGSDGASLTTTTERASGENK